MNKADYDILESKVLEVADDLIKNDDGSFTAIGVLEPDYFTIMGKMSNDSGDIAVFVQALGELLGSGGFLFEISKADIHHFENRYDEIRVVFQAQVNSLQILDK